MLIALDHLSHTRLCNIRNNNHFWEFKSKGEGTATRRLTKLYHYYLNRSDNLFR